MSDMSRTLLLRDSLIAADPHIRAEAASELGSLGEVSVIAVDRLTELLEDEYPWVVHAAAFALAKIGHFGGKAVLRFIDLMQMSAPSSEIIRIIAPQVFSTILLTLGDDTAEVVHRLASCLDDTNPDTRYAAAYGLRILGVRAKPETDRIIQSLEDESADIRFWIAVLLEEIAPLTLNQIERILISSYIDEQNIYQVLCDVLYVSSLANPAIRRRLESYRTENRKIFRDYFRLVDLVVHDKTNTSEDRN
jgi:HEAT repeat protein